MLSIQLIREHPEDVRRGLARRGASDAPLDELLRLDGQRRRTLQEVEALRGERNALSKEGGELARLTKTGETTEANEPEARRPPRAPGASARVATGPEREPSGAASRKPRGGLGGSLGIIGCERGAKLSGSR